MSWKCRPWRMSFRTALARCRKPVANLFFQMRVKLRAEAAGLASVAMEGDQIVLRYPPLPEGVTRANAAGWDGGAGGQECLLDAGEWNGRVRMARSGCWMRCLLLSLNGNRPSQRHLSQGFITWISVFSKWPVLRVTSVQRFCFAVAASRASMAEIGRPTASKSDLICYTIG